MQLSRREWLEKFIELADSGAPTLDYRRYLRIKAQHLPRYIGGLASCRVELAALVEQDKQAEVQEKKPEAPKETRRDKVQRRREREDSEGGGSADTGSLSDAGPSGASGDDGRRTSSASSETEDDSGPSPD